LPGGFRKELGGALREPQTGIRDDQSNSLQTALLEVLEERAPSGLVFLGALADAENVAKTLTIDADRDQQ
jgi:hypothetical protein